MKILLESYYILLPIIATAFMGWVGFLLKDSKKKEQERKANEDKKDREADRIRQANATGMMLVLRYMLKRYHSEYMLQGVITYAQYSDWKELFGAYTALGGNSVAYDWNDDIENLPRTDAIPNLSPFEIMLKEKMEKKN